MPTREVLIGIHMLHTASHARIEAIILAHDLLHNTKLMTNRELFKVSPIENIEY